MMKKKISVYQICFVALAVVLNLVGGELALVLRLPIYLDSIGTILTGALLGPWLGMLPTFLSGIIMGMSVDIYSLYFAPAGIIVGLMSGLVFQLGKKREDTGTSRGKAWIFAAALVIAVPGTVASAIICTVLFSGVTSSGSAVLVQILARTPLGMTASIILVQIVTEYLDRLVSLALVLVLLKRLPARWKRELAGGRPQGRREESDR